MRRAIITLTPTVVLTVMDQHSKAESGRLVTPAMARSGPKVAPVVVVVVVMTVNTAVKVAEMIDTSQKSHSNINYK